VQDLGVDVDPLLERRILSPSLGFQVSGFRLGLFRVSGSGFWVSGISVRESSGVHGRVQDVTVEVDPLLEHGILSSSFGFRVSGLGLGVSRVSGSGTRVAVLGVIQGLGP